MKFMKGLPTQWHSSLISKRKIADYKKETFIDGLGVRNSLYVSGCLFGCKGCYNTNARNFSYGFDFTDELLSEIIEDLRPSYIKGISFLGGEPFFNTCVCLTVAKKIREVFFDEKDIWCWTGFTYEELLRDDSTNDKKEFLSYIDVLIDGKFIVDLKDMNLKFRGSSNQRIIDVKKSWDKGVATIMQE